LKWRGGLRSAFIRAAQIDRHASGHEGAEELFQLTHPRQFWSFHGALQEEKSFSLNSFERIKIIRKRRKKRARFDSIE
jgi:hypothetical protein